MVIPSDPMYDIWMIGIGVCRKKGYTFTAECMENALVGNGKHRYYYNDSEIFKKISSMTKF